MKRLILVVIGCLLLAVTAWGRGDMYSEDNTISPEIIFPPYESGENIAFIQPDRELVFHDYEVVSGNHYELLLDLIEDLIAINQTAAEKILIKNKASYTYKSERTIGYKEGK